MSSSSHGPLPLAAEAWVEILACRARLRLPRLLRAESFLRRALTGDPVAPRRALTLGPLLAAFDTALRAQPGVPGCLPRSLALRRFLGRHGHAARLGLGLRRAEGRLRGHAWVEAQGAILTRDERFVRTFHPLETAGARRSSVRRSDG